MDYFKKETAKDYTAWDLNAKCCKNDNALEHRIKREARRKNRQVLKKMLDKPIEECYNTDTNEKGE